MKKMDILQIIRMLALIGGILLSLAIVLLILTDFVVKKPKKEEQKVENTFVSDVYDSDKDGGWIKCEEPSYRPVKLEECQISQIEDAKKQEFAWIEFIVINNQIYVTNVVY